MRSIVRRLTLVAGALLLTQCTQTTTEDPATTGTTRDLDRSTQEGVAGKGVQEADKRLDLRGVLQSVGEGTKATQRGSDLVADAHAYAVAAASRAGARDAAFTELRTARGADGLTHVRLRQMHQGLRVWGADVVVHASDRELIGMAGTIATGLEVIDTNTLMDGAQVLTRAKSDRFGSREVPTSREEVEKVVFVDASQSPHVAFHTQFNNELEGNIGPARWNHIFDARTGEVLARWNAIHTVSQASGAGGNAKFVHGWTNELDVEASGSSYVMTTARLKTVDLKNSRSGGTEVKGSLSAIGDRAINDAHGFAEVTLNMMQAWVGHNSIDDAGYRILSRVHYGSNYENAFWDGTQMTYGDGANTFHPLSGALDVVAHEINHGFTEFHSGLGYSDQAGGLNESFSDIAGKTAEFFYKAAPTWDLGSDIFKGSGALRYMCAPSTDGRSIDNASKMTPSLDPHYSSGPPNKAFCRASKRLSEIAGTPGPSGNPVGVASKDGVHRAASAFYLANAQYWTSSSTYVQACKGTVDAARALNFTAAEVGYLKDSWADVGVFCDGATAPPPPCDETFTTATGTLTSPNYPSNYGDNFSKTWCIDAPKGSKIKLAFSDFATESGYDFVTVADSTGAALSKKSGTAAPATASSQRIYVTFTSDESVVMKGWKASWTTE